MPPPVLSIADPTVNGTRLETATSPVVALRVSPKSAPIWLIWLPAPRRSNDSARPSKFDVTSAPDAPCTTARPEPRNRLPFAPLSTVPPSASPPVPDASDTKPDGVAWIVLPAASLTAPDPA